MEDKRQTKFDAKHLRKTVLDMAYSGATVHIGCAFSIIEILAVLYRKYLRYPENNPKSDLRDYLVLSKGHGVMAQYACMHELGWLSQSDIDNYFADGTKLKGLSDSRVTGLEVTSGSLGHGFSVGVGMALAAKLKNSGQKTYAIVGDGEINEGPIWEGALFAAHHELKDFMLIVDENGYQAMGATEEVLKLGSLKAKLDSFGFETLELDGHDEKQLDEAIQQLHESKSSAPKAIVAKTIKGKGVPFMENNNIWHYTRLTSETYTKAVSAIMGIEQ